MTDAGLLGIVTASVFGAAAVVPYFVAALRLHRHPAPRRSRRSPL